MAVVVQKELPYARCGVRSMQKTQGLTGIVLDIDEVGGASTLVAGAIERETVLIVSPSPSLLSTMSWYR